MIFRKHNKYATKVAVQGWKSKPWINDFFSMPKSNNTRGTAIE